MGNMVEKGDITMKKLICMVLAMLMVCGVALAVESPSLDGMTGSKVEVENPDADLTGFYVEPLNEFSVRYGLPEYELLAKIGDVQLEKLMACEKVTDYFGNVIVASTGEVRALIDLFDGVEPLIYEFAPIIAGGYHVDFGHVTATLLFATPYEPGQEVAVLIGVVEDEGYTIEDDLEDMTITWYAYRGLCVSVPEVEGGEGIEVVFEPEMMEVLQTKDTLVAIASEEFDFE